MAKIAHMESLVIQIAKLKEKEERIRQDLSILPSSELRCLPYHEIMKELGLVIPANVTITNLEFIPETKQKKVLYLVY